MSFTKSESFPCWSLIFKTIEVPAGLWRSKGRRILTFPPVLHLRSLDIFTTSPPPNLRTAVWAMLPQCPPPSSGALRGFFSFNWCTLRNSLLFSPHQKKNRGGKEKTSWIFFFVLFQLLATATATRQTSQSLLYINCASHHTPLPWILFPTGSWCFSGT